MALRARAERPVADPEITRAGFPELTRCDHCGVLDERTEPVSEFKGARRGDGWFWLHPECRALFKPEIIYPAVNSKGMFVIPRVYREQSWLKQPSQHRKPPLSNIRKRIKEGAFDQPTSRVIACGGLLWCACAPGTRERHRFRWERFIEIDGDGQWRQIMSDKPPFEVKPKCAYCTKDEAPVQLVAIGKPGRLDVHNAWLHARCEQGYLRMLGEND